MATDTKILVGTRKGAFVITGNGERTKWQTSEPTYLGHIIHHYVSDPRNPDACLMAAKTGHLGPTVFRSLDGGKSWKEATTPPAFSKSDGDETERAVERVFWLTPGHSSQKDDWYAGTSPAGLFHSKDNGDTWTPVDGFNNHPNYQDWCPRDAATPDGQFLHSIRIHPNDSSHLYIAISVGGVFESTDGGNQWQPLNKGCAADFMPDPNVEYGHDPHCLAIHPHKPERLYQQNHCGIYRMDLPEKRWIRIGDNMPRDVGDIGFPIVLHHTNPDRAWVFPMDGTEVWPRTSPGGKPCVYTTNDAGNCWTRQDSGLPSGNAFLTVLRQAMTADRHDPMGLYFGTTGGEVWASKDEGNTWNCIARHLPEIYSLHVQERR